MPCHVAGADRETLSRAAVRTSPATARERVCGGQARTVVTWGASVSGTAACALHSHVRDEAQSTAGPPGSTAGAGQRLVQQQQHRTGAGLGAMHLAERGVGVAAPHPVGRAHANRRVLGSLGDGHLQISARYRVAMPGGDPVDHIRMYGRGSVLHTVIDGTWYQLALTDLSAPRR
jgi:hypothetical protein